MQKNFNIFVKAILSGIYIAIAGTFYLVVSNNYTFGAILGSLLFSIALLVICNRGYYLYTGKVGYLLPYQKNNIAMVLFTILGNLLGILLLTVVISLSGTINIKQYAINASNIKLAKQWYEIIFSSILCGILMYTAVDGYTNIKSDFGKTIIIILAVMGFILAGFEHSIANMYYFLVGQIFSFKALGYILLMIIGNGLGALLINLLHTLLKKE